MLAIQTINCCVIGIHWVDLSATLLQDPTSAFLALGALTVSVVALWLSYFRGPSIELVNSPLPRIARLQPQNIRDNENHLRGIGRTIRERLHDG